MTSRISHIAAIPFIKPNIFLPQIEPMNINQIPEMSIFKVNLAEATQLHPFVI
jgi:hypothetical protein